MKSKHEFSTMPSDGFNDAARRHRINKAIEATFSGKVICEAKSRKQTCKQMSSTKVRDEARSYQLKINDLINYRLKARRLTSFGKPSTASMAKFHR